MSKLNLDFVALSYPREFTALTDFQSRNQRFLTKRCSDSIARFNSIWLT